MLKGHTSIDAELPSPARMRRALPVLIGVAVVVAGLIALLSYFQGRDDAGVAGAPGVQGPGALEADRGAAHRPGAAAGERAVPPPTSGPHEERNVTSERDVDDAALLHALELGDVVIAYPNARPPAALRALQREVSGAFDAELAAAGQMVVLVRRPGLDGVHALAWRRRLEASDAQDRRLRDFAEAWLGQGRGNTG